MHKFCGLAAVALVLGLSASTATAGPLITLSVEGSTSPGGPFSSSLTVQADTTYYYEVLIQMSAIGTVDGTHHQLARPERRRQQLLVVQFE